MLRTERGCHWSLVICHWSFVIGHLSLVICHWSFVIRHLSFVICYFSLSHHLTISTTHLLIYSSHQHHLLRTHHLPPNYAFFFIPNPISLDPIEVRPRR